MDIPGHPWYLGILNIVGMTYTWGVAWISQDVFGIPGYLVLRAGLTYTSGIAWTSQDVLGIPGYLVLQDRHISVG